MNIEEYNTRSLDYDKSKYKRIGEKLIIVSNYVFNHEIIGKLSSYPPNTRKILNDHKVLQLSDGGSELYGETWNRKV